MTNKCYLAQFHDQIVNCVLHSELGNDMSLGITGAKSVMCLIKSANQVSDGRSEIVYNINKLYFMLLAVMA